MKGWLYILLLLIAPDVFAGPYDPPVTDFSLHMLGVIFGSNIGDVYLGGAANPVMGEIMEKFNIVVVAIGTVIASYVSILSVINTAQEGETMGKKYSAVWIPMRSVAGLALMIPSPGSGYSMVQVTIAWLIVQAIGVADIIWNIALDGLQQGASATVGVQQAANTNSGSQFNTAASSLATDMLSVAICMQALQQFATDADHTNANGGQGDWLHSHASQIAYYYPDPTTTVNSNASSVVTSVTVSGPGYFGVKSSTDLNPDHTSTCGLANVEGTANSSDFNANYFNGMSNQEITKVLTDNAEKIYQAKLIVLGSMQSIYQQLAQDIVNGTIKTPNANALTTPINPAGYKGTAIAAYTDAMSGLIVPEDSASANSSIKNAISTGEQDGWVVAGAFYFILNTAMTTNYFSDLYNAPTTANIISCNAPQCTGHFFAAPPVYDISSNKVLTDLALTPAEIQSFNGYLATGAIYLQNDVLPSGQLNFSGMSSTSTGNPLADAIAGAINGIMGQLITMMNGVTAGQSGGDILLAHSQFGASMMSTMETTWLTLIGIAALLSLTTYIPEFFGPAGVYIGLLAAAIAIVLPIVGIVWSIGASLAIYAPLIPFIIFTTAAAGWFMVVIEAIIAAPLIAMGMLLPGGDELGRLETALMIMANVCLRPALMVVAFIVAGRIYNSIVHLIDLGLLQVLNTINVQTMFSGILILFLYASFIIGVTNTSFSIIYALPDRVMRWLGGHHEPGADMTAAKDTKAGVSAAASQVGQSAGGIGKGASEYAGTQAKALTKGYLETQKESVAKQKAADGANAAHQQMVSKSRAEDDLKKNQDLHAKGMKPSLDQIGNAAKEMQGKREAKANFKDVLGQIGKDIKKID